MDVNQIYLTAIEDVMSGGRMIKKGDVIVVEQVGGAEPNDIGLFEVDSGLVLKRMGNDGGDAIGKVVKAVIFF